MIPAGKITELAAIGAPNVVAPEALVFDDRGHPVGYTMPFVPDCVSLCRLLTRAWRARNGVGHSDIQRLVWRLREGVQRVHDAGCLIVDLNEMNLLVRPGRGEVYFIDVDSYQTARYPARALMDSVRDWQVTGGRWSTLSDWFSFAVVSFHLFCGVHPYRGRHPDLNGLEARMRANVSVFNPAVGVPRACFPLEVIPPAWRGWYRAVLEEGARCPPPPGGGAHAAPARRAIPVAGAARPPGRLELRRLCALPGPIRGYVAHRGVEVAWTEPGGFVDRRRRHGPAPGAAAVGFTPRSGRPVLAGRDGDRLWLVDLDSGRRLPVDLRADAVRGYDGRILVRSRARIVEVMLSEVGGGLIASGRPVARVLPMATRLFEGAVIQSVLGACWATLFPRRGAAVPVRLSALDGLQVVEARYDGGVLMALARRGGRWERWVFRFDARCGAFDQRVVEGAAHAGLNFVTLDTGVCVALTGDERLELFASQVNSSALEVVEDPSLGGDMRLRRREGRVVFLRGDEVWSMALQ